MSLLFDKYLVRAMRGTEMPEKWTADYARQRAFLSRVQRTHPDHAPEAKKLLGELEEHANKATSLTAEIFQYLRAAEQDFGVCAEETTVVCADNVGQYYFDSADKKWEDKDFPVVSPPYPCTWVEFARPPSKAYPPDWPSRFALWVHAAEVPVEASWNESSAAFQLCKKVGFDCPGKPRWLVRALLYIKRRDDEECIGPVRVWMIALGADGGIVAKDGSYIDDSRAKHVDCERLLGCGLLTFSLLHCKNVSVQENEPQQKHSRIWQKKNGAPLAKFKTLNIEPMRKVLSHDGGADSNGLKMAMHICRGHFKDYREHGLFGKRKGIYWWDSVVRGTAEQGIVYKDYSVSAPKVSA